MNEQIINYVDSLLTSAPDNRRIGEMREELIGDLTDKYNDLVERGLPPEQAFEKVITGIGDMQGLIEDLGREPAPALDMKNNKPLMHYLVGGASVLAGVLLFLIFTGFNWDWPGVIVSVLFLAFALGNFIYGAGLNQPVPYQKEDDSFVEEYKYKNSQPSRNARLRGAASGFLWVCVVIVYFLVSFLGNNWEYSWVIFLMGAVLQQVISAIFSDKKRALTSGMIYTTATIVYLILSFGTQAWHLTWLCWLGAVAVDQAIRFFRIWKEK